MQKRTLVIAVIAFAAGWATSLPAEQGRRYFSPRTPADTTAPPYSASVLANGTLYLAGTIGRNADGSIPDTAQAEATNVLNNVKGQLEAAGMTMDDLVTIQVFASNPADYDAFNRVYRTYFTREFPARAFVGAGPLLNSARFELQGIAVKR
jgi:2-iminobutanoate/2-iminopropanoate deaminase